MTTMKSCDSENLVVCIGYHVVNRPTSSFLRLLLARSVFQHHSIFWCYFTLFIFLLQSLLLLFCLTEMKHFHNKHHIYYFSLAAHSTALTTMLALHHSLTGFSFLFIYNLLSVSFGCATTTETPSSFVHFFSLLLSSCVVAVRTCMRHFSSILVIPFFVDLFTFVSSFYLDTNNMNTFLFLFL